MITSSEITIKSSGVTPVMQTLNVKALYLEKGETYFYDGTQTIKKLNPDGQAVRAVDLAKDTQAAFICGNRVILVRPSGGVRVVCFYDLESGHILRGAREFPIQYYQPNAIRNGDQIIVNSQYGLVCFNSHGSLIKQVKVDCPSMNRKGSETSRYNDYLNALDMCYYDQYAVLLLMESTIYRADLQSGHSKLVTYVADNAKSIHCNNTFIFVGVSRESGLKSPIEKMLVFDRVSGKL